MLLAMNVWLHQLLSPEGIEHLVASGGLLAVCAIIFAETGLLVGFFLPGDSLLFLAGTLCTVDLLDPSKPPPLDYLSLCSAVTIAAVLGNSLNYLLGRLAGQRAWAREEGRFFTRRRLEQAHGFYERHGVLSLVVTRFVPVARTFVPFVAGMSRMGFARFSWWNFTGALCWVLSLTAAGYRLGQIAVVQRHIELIVLAVILVSLLPVAIAAGLRLRRDRAGAGQPQAAAPTAPIES